MEELESFMKGSDHKAHDQAIFADQEEYAKYYRYIRKVFIAFLENLVSSASSTDEGGKQEVTILISYLARILKTIELMQLKYRYDKSHRVRIDMSSSSFPNVAEVRQMVSDHECRKDLTSRLGEVSLLKERVLDELKKSDEEPLVALDSLSKREYFNRLEPMDMFLLFNAGELLPLRTRVIQNRRSYLYHWAVYDVETNRPRIYILEFEYSGEQKFTAVSPDFPDFMDIIKRFGKGNSPLSEMAKLIDHELEYFHPKKLKRFDIGPIHGFYSKDEHPLSTFFSRHRLDNDAFIVWYEAETVLSEGEVLSKSGFFSKERPFQRYRIPSTDTECIRRKVTSVHKSLLAPHYVMQHLYADELCKEAIESVNGNLVTLP